MDISFSDLEYSCHLKSFETGGTYNKAFIFGEVPKLF